MVSQFGGMVRQFEGAVLALARSWRWRGEVAVLWGRGAVGARCRGVAVLSGYVAVLSGGRGVLHGRGAVFVVVPRLSWCRVYRGTW
ncbi:MAG: hypothetical protein ACPGXK_04240 [Phycisphaerae bacterium]